MCELLVLGAGVAGISCAYHAKRKGVNCLVLEKDHRAGGLLDNFEVEGFRFDKAIHLSFTNDKYVRSIFDSVPHYCHYPDVWCYEKPRWLKHPVQNNLFPLPIDERISLIRGFFDRPDIVPNDYREWLIHQYGERIAHRYPIRYTKKYWALEPENIGLDWIGDRLRRASADEILRGAMTEDTGNGYYALEMRYPQEGGYRSFIEPMLTGLNIVYGKHVVKVNTRSRCVTCADGTEYGYDLLVNTLPLPLFVEMLDDVPTAISEAGKSLWATQVDLLSVGISRVDAVPHLWFYLYDEDIFPARAYSPGHKSKKNVPIGYSALQFEVYSDPRNHRELSSDFLKEHAIEVLHKLDIASPSEVLFVDHRRLPFGNVVFDHGMEARREYVRQHLGQRGVVLAGRFGEWEYFWSDQALLSGKRAAESLFVG